MFSISKLVPVIFLSVFSSQLFADELDDKLRFFLKQDDIKPLKFKADRKSPLFKLGRALFMDPILSGNRNIACGTCHAAKLASADGLPLPIGEGGEGLGPERTMGNGRVIGRHSPHLLNFAVKKPSIMFWDARVSFNKKKHTFITPEKGLNGRRPKRSDFTKILNSALSAQALFPVTSPDEMLGRKGSNKIADMDDNFEIWAALMKRLVGTDNGRLGGRPFYKKMFRRAFPRIRNLDDLNMAHAAVAIAHFEENAFTRLNSPFDRYLAGDNKAMTEKEKKGAVVFYGSGQCFLCHSGVLQNDGKLHNSGFPQIGPGKEDNGDDKGRYYITKDPEDLYAFKTPSLRNLAQTAPYGHSGAFATLEAVVMHYSQPVAANQTYEIPYDDLPYDIEVERDHMRKRLMHMDPLVTAGIQMSYAQKQDLVQFLKTGLLSD